jgi:hypothetical protein
MPQPPAREFAKWWKQRGRDDFTLVLWAAWNPIGFPVPLNEYEDYSDRLISLLGKESTVDEIAAELGRIRTETMGMQPEPRLDEIAADTLKWWHYWAVEECDWNQAPDD